MLDPTEGACYIEPVHEDNSDKELDCIYQFTMKNGVQVNLTTDGRLSWDRDCSCTSDSDEEVERWQNQRHEVTTLSYNRMVGVGTVMLVGKVAKEPVVWVKSKPGVPKVFTSQKAWTSTKGAGMVKPKLKHGDCDHTLILVVRQTNKSNPQ